MQQNQNNKPSDARRLGTYLGILGIGLIVLAFAFKIFGIDGSDAAFIIPCIFGACLIRLLLPSFWK